MTIVQSLQQAIDYMETHLLEDLKIEDIAKQAHLSPYHFQRTFFILTNMTVADYLRKRRLTIAANELCNTNTKIIDIAYKYGYKTPESFSKAFYKLHGITPSDARKGLGNLQSYNRLVIQVHLKGAEPMIFKLVEREAFQVTGVKETFTCNDHFDQSKQIGKFWSQVGQNGTIDRLMRLNDGQISGLIGATVDYNEKNDQIEYWIAAETSNPAPEGFLQYEIPAEKWAVFEMTGPVAKVVPETWKKIYSEWFPSNNFEHSGAPSLEVYKTADPTSPEAKTEIWVPVK